MIFFSECENMRNVEIIIGNCFRRRTLKNRGYAASCRIKRLEQKDELETEKGKEFEDLDKLQVEMQVENGDGGGGCHYRCGGIGV